MNRKQLERAAVRAHAEGTGWNDFYGQHRAAIEQAEPWDLAARSKLVTRLSLLVTTGDLHGSRPIGDWWEDHRARQLSRRRRTIRTRKPGSIGMQSGSCRLMLEGRT